MDHAQRIAKLAAGKLYDSDQASQMLGMAIDSVAPGCARVTMRVRPDMVNGHGICHGGLIFALADNGIYEVEVRNDRGEAIALFRGRCHQIAGRLVDE